MRSPWRSLVTIEPDREYLVLAPSIPPRRRSSTWRLFRGADYPPSWDDALQRLDQT